MDQPTDGKSLNNTPIFRILMVGIAVIVVFAAILALASRFSKKSNSNSTNTVQSTNGTSNTSQQFDTRAGTSPVDTDHDGLTDAEEQHLGTNPTNPDTDQDGLSDFDEVKKYHTDPKNVHSGSLSITDGEAIKQGINPLTGEKLFATVPATNVNK